jgi:plastocyanin
MSSILKLFLVLLFFHVSQVLAATSTVTISNFQFSPNQVIINIGDTIKWVNNDAFAHTTSSDQSGLWDKTLAQGAVFTRVFNTEGSYSYHCNIHPTMMATVVVRSPEQTRIETGKNILANIVPIKLNLTGKNANLAYLGSYIVNAQSGCANCHSCPTYKEGNNPYLGQAKKFNTVSYLAGGVNVSAGGTTMVSANLTPDTKGKPAGLSLDEFKKLLRTGHAPDVPGALLSVMPWPIFGMMIDNDLNAVYEYLRSIPPATTPVAQCAEPEQ